MRIGSFGLTIALMCALGCSQTVQEKCLGAQRVHINLVNGKTLAGRITEIGDGSLRLLIDDIEIPITFQNITTIDIVDKQSGDVQDTIDIEEIRSVTSPS